MKFAWTEGPANLNRRLLRTCLAGAGLLLACMAHAQVQPEPQVLVLGTARANDNYAGVVLRRIHQEAFQRLGVPVEFKTIPTARLAVELSADHIDGDLARPWAFGDSQPNLIRVEEPNMYVSFSLWTVNPNNMLQRLDQLPASGLSVVSTRGVVECEQGMQALLPANRVSSVTTTVNALSLLQLGRSDLHCGLDIAVLSDAGTAQFIGRPAPIRVLNIGEPIALYLYLQRKHAALAPKLAAILKKMRAEGTIDQIRNSVLREYRLAPWP